MRGRYRKSWTSYFFTFQLRLVISPSFAKWRHEKTEEIDSFQKGSARGWEYKTFLDALLTCQFYKLF